MMEDRLAQHRKATAEAQDSLGFLPTEKLLARGLALLLRNLRPTIYDFPPDEAALIEELTDRGQRFPTRRPRP